MKLPQRFALEQRKVDLPTARSFGSSFERHGRVPAAILEDRLYSVVAGAAIDALNLGVLGPEAALRTLEMPSSELIDIAAAGPHLVALDLSNNALVVVKNPISPKATVRSFKLPYQLCRSSRICPMSYSSFLIALPDRERVVQEALELISTLDDVPSPRIQVERSVPGLNGPIAWDPLGAMLVVTAGFGNSIAPVDWHAGSAPRSAFQTLSKIHNCFSLTHLLDGMFGIQRKYKNANVVLVCSAEPPYLEKIAFTAEGTEKQTLTLPAVAESQDAPLALAALWSAERKLVLHFEGSDNLILWEGGSPFRAKNAMSSVS